MELFKTRSSVAGATKRGGGGGVLSHSLVKSVASKEKFQNRSCGDDSKATRIIPPGSLSTENMMPNVSERKAARCSGRRR